MTERESLAASALVQEEMEFLQESQEDIRRRFPGRHLVIRGRQVVGSYGTEAEAYAQGVRLCGLSPFLLVEVGAEGAHARVPVLVAVGAPAPGPAAGGGGRRFVLHPPRWGPIVDNPLEILDAGTVD